MDEEEKEDEEEEEEEEEGVASKKLFLSDMGARGGWRGGRRKNGGLEDEVVKK